MSFDIQPYWWYRDTTENLLPDENSDEYVFHDFNHNRAVPKLESMAHSPLIPNYIDVHMSLSTGNIMKTIQKII